MNLTHSIFGQIITVRKFTHGDVEFDFYHEDEIITYRYSSDPNRLGNFPKDLIEILVSTLATDICVEIFLEMMEIQHTLNWKNVIMKKI